MFKKKRVCEHEYETLGMFYKENITTWRDHNDSINTYKRCKCKTCGEVKDILLASELFVPEKFHDRDERKDKYIEYLRQHNIKSEIDLYL